MSTSLVFKCPKCSGMFFGSTGGGLNIEYHCHDQFNLNCQWSGLYEECFPQQKPVPVVQPSRVKTAMAKALDDYFGQFKYLDKSRQIDLYRLLNHTMTTYGLSAMLEQLIHLLDRPKPYEQKLVDDLKIMLANYEDRYKLNPEDEE